MEGKLEMCAVESMVSATKGRDMRPKAVKNRILGFMAHAKEMLKDLPDTYQPSRDSDEDSSDEEDGNSVRKHRKMEFEKRRQALIKRGLMGSASRAKSRQELEDRLQAKMATLGKGAPNRQEKGEKKKLKLAKKAVMAEKKLEKKRDKKRQRNKIKKKGEKAAAASEKASGSVREGKSQEAKKEAVAGGGLPEESGHRAQKGGDHQDESIAFSKFDFSGSGNDPSTRAANKNLKKVLNALQKTKEKEKKLEEKGDVEGLKTLKETTSWENALSKADGKKVRTDLTLVKKSLKRLEAKKKSSSKKWKDRQTQESEKKQQRQDKRKANIQSRRDAKTKKKVKRSIKKGRVVF